MFIFGRTAIFVVVVVVSVAFIAQQRRVHAVVVTALCCAREEHCTVITDVIHIVNSHIVWIFRSAVGIS